jgi:hypothetical protein
VKASGPNNRPSCACKVNTGMNDSVMINRREKQRRPDFRRRFADHLPVLLTLQRLAGVTHMPSLDVLVRVFDHHHRCIDHRTDGDRDAAQRHDVGIDALVVHDDKRGQDAERQETIATSAERRWNRKTAQTTATTINSSSSL